MRGTVDGLLSPHPIGHRLPALFQDDDLAMRFTAACDEVLAPVFLTLDNLPAHLDPTFAPVDLLEWLAGWVGLVVDETWPEERLRSLVAGAIGLHRRRGTLAGLQALLDAVLDVDTEVSDNGGAVASPLPGGAAPGTAGPEVLVLVRAKKAEVDLARVAALVRSATPAHIRTRVEVRAR